MSRRSNTALATQRAYQLGARAYIQHWGRRKFRESTLLAEMVKQLRCNAVVLDAGCGLGQDIRHLARKGCRVIGLDLNWTFLAYANRRARSLGVLQADIGGLPFARAGIDAVWAAASLIHFPKTVVTKNLRSLLEIVVPGGLFGATFAYGRRSGVMRRGWIPGRYFSKWQRAELTKSLKKAGWQIVSIQTVTNRERKGRWLNILARRPY